MEDEIKPFEGVGYFRFGTSRYEVRKSLDKPIKEFMRNNFAVNSCDIVGDQECFLEYDSNDLLEAVEFTSKREPVFVGKILFDMPYEELLEYFRGMSDKHEADDFGVTFFDLGFGVSKDQRMGKTQSVIVFSKDYW